MGIGLRSMESDDGVEFADRIDTVYDCPAGHTVIVPFCVDAEIPAVWDCRCGTEAYSRDHADAPPTPTKHTRTHWEMLLERRTIPELEALLAERLALLRGGRARMSNTG
jgi:hypothetical protein